MSIWVWGAIGSFLFILSPNEEKSEAKSTAKFWEGFLLVFCLVGAFKADDPVRPSGSGASDYYADCVEDYFTGIVSC